MEDDAVRELEHTADIGFEVEAGSLNRLFRLAASGLVSALGLPGGAIVAADPEGAADAEVARDPEVARNAAEVAAAEESTGELSLERPDLERLLVAWLREILHRASVERRLPHIASLRVRRAEGAAALEARLTWRRSTDEPDREIKGVTYHGLRVERSGGRWHATVVLDV